MADHPSEDCVFCAIERSSEHGSVVYEDDRVFAIMDTGPVNPGHVLVMPRQHAPYLKDMDEDTGAHLFCVTMRIAQAIRESAVRSEGINLFLADGEAAFQEIFHLHMHVFPRFEGDPFEIDADWTMSPPRSELDEIAADIRDAYINRFGEDVID